MFNKKSKENNQYDTIIGPDVLFKGTIDGNDNVNILGTVEGDIKTSGIVEIGSAANIIGSITSRSVVNLGSVNGNVYADDNVTLGESSRTVGDISAGVLNIAPGAIFSGKSRMKNSTHAVKNAPKPQLEDTTPE